MVERSIDRRLLGRGRRGTLVSRRRIGSMIVSLLARVVDDGDLIGRGSLDLLMQNSV